MRGPPDTFTKPENVPAPANEGTIPNNSMQGSGGASDADNSVDAAQALLEEYGWMINSEECDREIWAELEQEEQLQEMFENAYQEEECVVYFNLQQPPQNNGNSVTNSNNNNSDADISSAENQMEKLSFVNDIEQNVVSRGRLNPNATEFIPRSQRCSTNNNNNKN